MSNAQRVTFIFVAMLLVFGLLPRSAFAQGAYIGAFLVGDVVRLDQYDPRSGDSGSGEAFGFGLRLGTPVGAKWGVELEFVRPGEITSDRTPQILPASIDVMPVQIPGLPNVGSYDPLVFPSYRFRTTERRATLAPALWIRQELSPRFSLAYLGGVAFGRTSNEVEVTYQISRPSILPIPPIPPVVTESITYDVQPLVGVEGRLRLAGKVDLIPALRLQGAAGGWLIRPAIGIAWAF